MLLLISLLSASKALRLEDFMATCQVALMCFVSSRFSTPV